MFWGQNLVHLEGSELLKAYALIEVVIPARLVRTIDSDLLPDDWREPTGSAALRKIGDDWLRGQRSLALRVPSAIFEVETNLLINPRHPQVERLKVAEARTFMFDCRLDHSSD